MPTLFDLIKIEQHVSVQGVGEGGYADRKKDRKQQERKEITKLRAGLYG